MVFKKKNLRKLRSAVSFCPSQSTLVSFVKPCWASTSECRKNLRAVYAHTKKFQGIIVF